MARYFVAQRTSRGIILLLVAVLAWLWFVLINDLRVEWTVNSQYGYGWAVSFLCVLLVWQHIQQRGLKKRGSERGPIFARLPPYVPFFILVLLALFYFPTRLVQEANSGWRLTSWALALEVVGITLCGLCLVLASKPWPVGGRRVDEREASFAFYQHVTISDLVFPLCFFLVAVPWPTWLEQTLIQGLTRADAAAAVEMLGWLGIPAMPHGNVIEVATGAVGIDEACSGIRSFQATLMISLFLGEHYSLSTMHRVYYVVAGFGLSFIFNLARMVLLVWVAANQGISAISKWHDPAGITILLACFCGLWGVGAMMARIERRKTVRNKIKMSGGEDLVPDSGQKGLPPSTINSGSSILRPLTLVLTFWVLLTEVSIEGWYRWHEARLPKAIHWTMAWPSSNPTFKELPLAERTREILRYDESRSVAWQENGVSWQVVFLRWNPGRTALHLAQNHTPEVCMTAAGHKLNVVAEQKWFTVATSEHSASTNNLELPFAIYEVQDADQAFYVFYCLWNDRANAQGFRTMLLNYHNRLAPVLAGLRNPGQRSVEIAISGPRDEPDAEKAVRGMLGKYIQVN